MHFTPKDQILLLSGLGDDEALRARLWALPELRSNLRRLAEAGLVDDGRLTRPGGVDAARSLHHMTLDDLLDEHLPGELAAPHSEEADGQAVGRGAG